MLPPATAADGKNATASITVTMARRPSCTVGGGACLSVSPASGAVDNTSFVATASGFAADSTLLYDFGVQSAAGKQSFFVRSAADPRFTFAPRVLPEGASTMFVCAKGTALAPPALRHTLRRARAGRARPAPFCPADQAGAQACSTANVTVLPAAQQVTAADISALGSSLTTALSSGSTDAVLSVVRQLSAAASSQPTDAPPEDAAAASAAATEQAESAMGAMEDLLGADATVEESLGVADAGGLRATGAWRVAHEMCRAGGDGAAVGALGGCVPPVRPHPARGPCTCSVLLGGRHPGPQPPAGGQRRECEQPVCAHGSRGVPLSEGADARTGLACACRWPSL